MQVVSGPIGREKVDYEAPSHDRLEKEMATFLKWLNGRDETDLVLKSALAHFGFVTIHPFEDGNGRIARAIADMMLARSERTSHRFYSMSAQIEQERKAYYDVLEKMSANGQKGPGAVEIREFKRDHLRSKLTGQNPPPREATCKAQSANQRITFGSMANQLKVNEQESIVSVR